MHINCIKCLVEVMVSNTTNIPENICLKRDLSFTLYHMTQSHHMTSQKIASADPGDALNQRKLAEAENRKETKILS